VIVGPFNGWLADIVVQYFPYNKFGLIDPGVILLNSWKPSNHTRLIFLLAMEN